MEVIHQNIISDQNLALSSAAKNKHSAKEEKGDLFSSPANLNFLSLMQNSLNQTQFFQPNSSLDLTPNQLMNSGNSKFIGSDYSNYSKFSNNESTGTASIASDDYGIKSLESHKDESIGTSGSKDGIKNEEDDNLIKSANKDSKSKLDSQSGKKIDSKKIDQDTAKLAAKALGKAGQEGNDKNQGLNATANHLSEKEKIFNKKMTAHLEKSTHEINGEMGSKEITNKNIQNSMNQEAAYINQKDLKSKNPLKANSSRKVAMETTDLSDKVKKSANNHNHQKHNIVNAKSLALNSEAAKTDEVHVSRETNYVLQNNKKSPANQIEKSGFAATDKFGIKSQISTDIKSNMDSDFSSSSKQQQNGFSMHNMNGAERFSSLSKTEDNPVLRQNLQQQIDQLLQKAKVIIRENGNAQLSTKLNPEHLGEISVKLTLVNGKLKGKFTVDNNQVQKELHEKIGQIFADLKNDGFIVDSFQVDIKNDPGQEQNTKDSFLASVENGLKQNNLTGGENLADQNIELNNNNSARRVYA